MDQGTVPGHLALKRRVALVAVLAVLGSALQHRDVELLEERHMEGDASAGAARSLASGGYGHMTSSEADPHGPVHEMPEDGGDIVRGLKKTVLGPPNVFPEEHDEDPYTTKRESKAAYGSGSGSGLTGDSKTQYSNRRKGYEQVVRYMEAMARRPAEGSGDSMGSAMLQDPEIAHTVTRIQTAKDMIDKANEQRQHATKMVELLTEDREAVVSSAPLRPNALQKAAAETQLKKLDKAIHHEKVAQLLWYARRGKATKDLSKLMRTQKKLQIKFVEKDATLRANYLKKLAREHVDFDMWRASHTGPENADYIKWKSEQTMDKNIHQENSNLEQLRAQLESSIDTKMRSEFTNVQREVNAAQNRSVAHDIVSKINAMSASADYQETERTTAAERNAVTDYHDLSQKLDDDMAFFQHHIDKAKALASMPRKRLESNQAKIERLKGLVVAGVVRPAMSKRQRRKQAKRVEADKTPLLSASTQAAYDVHLAKGVDAHVEAQQEQQLNERVEKAEERERQYDKQRFDNTQATADELLKDEHREQALSGLKMRELESQAKLNAVQRIKDLNQKMAAIGGDVEGGAAEEMKAKKEAAELDKNLRKAKIVYSEAARVAKDRHDEMHTLIRHDDPEHREVPPDTDMPEAAASPA